MWVAIRELNMMEERQQVSWATKLQTAFWSWYHGALVASSYWTFYEYKSEPRGFQHSSSISFEEESPFILALRLLYTDYQYKYHVRRSSYCILLQKILYYFTGCGSCTCTVRYCIFCQTIPTSSNQKLCLKRIYILPRLFL